MLTHLKNAFHYIPRQAQRQITGGKPAACTITCGPGFYACCYNAVVVNVCDCIAYTDKRRFCLTGGPGSTTCSLTV